MNLTIPAIDLKKIVKKISAVQSANVTLRTGSIQSDDDTWGVVVSYPFETEPIIVNTRLFSSTCNKLTKGVTLQQDGGSPLVIKSQKFKAEIPISKLDTNIQIPASSLSELEIESKELVSLLSFASQVTDDKNTFDHTGAIQLIADELGMTVRATDNLRIVTTCDGLKYPSFTTLIPSKIVKAVKELEGLVSISQTDSAIYFQAGDTTIYTRKLTKKFPNVDKVMPQSYKLEVEIKTQDFLDVLDRVSPTIDPETSNRTVLDFQGDVLKVSTGNELVGKSLDEITCNPLIPDALDEMYPLQIAVNANYVKLFLTSIKDCVTIITFKANDKEKPFLMEAGTKKILMAGVRI